MYLIAARVTEEERITIREENHETVLAMGVTSMEQIVSHVQPNIPSWFVHEVSSMSVDRYSLM